MYSGGAIMPLVDLFRSDLKKINYYINNHEQNCGHSATGYAKSTNKTGVSIVTSGPGMTNSVTPLLDAQNDSTPFVLLTGQVSTNVMGTLAFQESPAVAISSPVTKWSYCAKPKDDLFDLIKEAFRVANYGKKGAVHIDLPKDILNGKDCKVIFNFNNNNNNDNDNNNKYDFNKLHQLIIDSKRPILCVGKGCNDYQYLLTEFINKYHIPITTTIHAKGVFDENHFLSLGFLGMHGQPTANFAIQSADLIIGLGYRFDDRTTGNIEHYAPKCNNIIHVNIENSELGKIVDTDITRYVHKINLDCGTFLENMSKINNNNNNNNNDWIDIIRKWKIEHPITINKPKNDKLNSQMVINYLNNIIPKNTIITTGVGNHQMYAAQFINLVKSKQFITSGSLGVMGAGLPYAIGAQIGNMDKLVIDIDGDGSFNQTSSDLQTVSQYNLPIKIIVLNDGHMSMVRVWEKLFFNENHVATKCHNPDYNKLADSHNIKNIKISNVSDLKLLDQMIAYNGPILCNAIVETDFCLPLVAPGKALDDMIMKINESTHMDGVVPS